MCIQTECLKTVSKAHEQGKWLTQENCVERCKNTQGHKKGDLNETQLYFMSGEQWNLQQKRGES